jgi:hypothetical protein
MFRSTGSAMPNRSDRQKWLGAATRRAEIAACSISILMQRVTNLVAEGGAARVD